MNDDPREPGAPCPRAISDAPRTEPIASFEQVGRRWLLDNLGTIDACNRRIEQQGCFADSLRRF
ncbi:type II toxin-antitoxin system CcdA family antitoxin [Burkholderiaceae bacterium FT117]|uniref:type II toxin-antitoxin system CcdA family antitoxin n=1 Tax=Zeimonas sediminis TaxID=2944268 RepID=UPI002342D3C2|nr:type II toxin-antitoxin system CcdA family antitoxin [Zeimonas sediminis]MCM5572108.1 type II toxin-antitoxin system CcdA family antitoxin [Zeimonas sediminis]